MTPPLPGSTGDTRKRVLEAVTSVIEDTGKPPTTREVAQLVGVSNGTAAYHMKALADAGVIQRESTDTRARVMSLVRRQVLDYGTNPTIPDVARALGLSSTAATRAVAALVQEGLLAQGPGFPDRLLTLRGQHFEAAVGRLAQQVRAAAVTRPGDGDLRAVAALISRLGSPCPEANVYDREACVADVVRWSVERNGRAAAAVEVEDATGWPRTTTRKALRRAAHSGRITEAPGGWRSPTEDRTYTAALMAAKAMPRLPDPLRSTTAEVLGSILRP